MKTTTRKKLTGRERRDRGIKRAVVHANQVHQDWSDKAFSYLKWFVNTRGKKKRFLTEDVRESSGTLVPEPPSLRAWGGVIQRAAKEGLIKRVSITQVNNPNAHSCFASVWTKA